jgi:hypothetical protein
LGVYIFMEAFLFMASKYLMEAFGWGSLTSPWYDDYAYWFGGFLKCSFLVDHRLIAHLMVMEHDISSWCVFSYTSLSWMCYVLFMDDGSIPPRVLHDGSTPPKGLDDGVRRYMFHDVVGDS